MKTTQEDSGSGIKPRVYTEASKSGHLHRRDLWQEAFEKLDSGKKEILTKQKAVGGANAVQEVQKIVEDKYIEYNKGDKGRSKVSEWVKKTLKAVLSFKMVVDAVVEFDRTKYGQNHSHPSWSLY